MRTTIDKAGRVVIPKALRDRVGLVAGEVEVTADGAALRIEPVASGTLVEKDGRLVMAATGVIFDDDLVLRLRDEDREWPRHT